MMDPIAVPWEPRPGVPAAITVSQLARLIRETVRTNPLLSRILVRGEVSNLQTASAGHVFFTLKDATAQVSCTLFREDAELLGFDLEDGMDVVVSPALVQGPGAPASLRRALAVVADRVDVVILARGGGSLEDLWCFNDEGLARAVALCRVPVVSAIGHETDVTIVDFVADVRAATPSAAAELVSPDVTELMARVNGAGHSLVGEIREALQVGRNRMIALRERLSPRGLQRGVEANRALLDRSFAALVAVGPREVTRQRDRLEGFGRRLDVLSPLATLQRGYAIAEREGGHGIALAAEVEAGDALAVRLQDCRVRAHVHPAQEVP